MPRYLTYSPGRRRVWTEHTCFPAKAIRIWEADRWRSKYTFKFYWVSQDGSTITEIPESEWEAHSE